MEAPFTGVNRTGAQHCMKALLGFSIVVFTSDWMIDSQNGRTGNGSHGHLVQHTAKAGIVSLDLKLEAKIC